MAAALLLVLTILLSTTVATPAEDSMRWQSYQIAIWQVSNRLYHGRSNLVLDPTLTAYAEAQADRMAASASIYHQDLRPLQHRGWSWVGEAVASGWDLWSAHAAICYSPPHLALQLEPRALALGAGAAMRPDGSTYVSVILGDVRR